MCEEGAASAYPYAWRLPGPARELGAQDFARARLALAQTLFALGRFAQARETTPETDCLPVDEGARAQGLQARCDILLGREPATLPPPTTLTEHTESAYLALLADRPGMLLAGISEHRLLASADATATAWCEVFAIWAQARLKHGFSQAGAHTALARLRPLTPAAAAHAEAVLAESAFHAAPAWSVVWLDAALEQCARYAQHHVEVRLLLCKSQALQATGQIREAERFQKLAASLAKRQGLKQSAMTDG